MTQQTKHDFGQFPERLKNVDSTGGAWHVLNLQQPPFNFPLPELIINEGCTEEGGKWADKSLALWRISDLPEMPQ